MDKSYNDAPGEIDQLRLENKELKARIAELEEPIRSSEERFRAISEHAFISICILNTAGKVIWVNEALVKLGGFSAKEVEHIRKDGSIFPTQMSASLIRDNEGKPQFMSATAIDITSLKDAENALRKSEAELSQSQQIANMGSWYFDVATQKVTSSENYFRMIGAQPSDIDPSYNSFYNLIHPDDAHLMDQFMQDLEKPGKPVNLDMCLVLSNGTIKWVQNSVVPFYEGGELVALKEVNIVITEKKICGQQFPQEKSGMANGSTRINRGNTIGRSYQ